MIVMGTFMPSRRWPVVMCPRCRVQMGVAKVTPAGPGTAGGVVLYACEICKTERPRPYSTPPIEPKASEKGQKT